MSRQDILFIEEFGEYRREVIKRGVSVIREIFKEDKDPDFIKGALFMMKQILKIPLDFAKTKEAKNNAGIMVERDFKEFETNYLRSVFYDDGE